MDKVPAQFDIVDLINAVKQHPVLYAKDLKRSKDCKNFAWEEIANDLKLPVSTVKIKWRSLKDSISRLRRDKLKTGKRSWYLLKHLKFLPNVEDLVLEFQNYQHNTKNSNIKIHDDLESTSDSEYLKSEFSFVEQSNSLDDSSHIYQEDEIIEEVSDSVEDNDPHTMTEIQEQTEVHNHFEFIENEPSAGQSSDKIVEVEPPPKKIIKLSEKPKLTKYKRIAPKVNPIGGCTMPSAGMSHERVYKINSIGTATAVSTTPTFIVLPNHAKPVNVIGKALTAPPNGVKGKDDANQQDENGLQERLLNICEQFSDEEFGYGMHIAHQLRSFPTLEREILRNKINTLIYNSKMNLLSEENVSIED